MKTKKTDWNKFKNQIVEMSKANLKTLGSSADEPEWEMFANLIVEITKTGLNFSDATQCGVDKRTGNVWIRSNKWIGSAFISPNDPNIYWCYTCECGNQKIFSSYKKMKGGRFCRPMLTK